MDDYVYHNGRIVPGSEARVSVFDAGFTHAAGLFETMRAFNGRVMRLEEHLQRMADSAATLEMQIAVDHAAITAGIDDVLAANSLTDARIRLVMTPGCIPRPGRPMPKYVSSTVLITAGPVRAYPTELYEQGMRVCICPYRQNKYSPLAGHKTLAYLPRLLAIKEASDRRCNEALWFTTDNLLAEGSVCNVFVYHQGKLMTPAIETPILPGTVRKAVVELARANKIPVEEGPIDIEILLAATEVFLTGSVMEIMPVTSIEKHEVGKGIPGETTLRLRALYSQLVARECGT